MHAFRRIAETITVSEIAEPILVSFPDDSLVPDVWDEWTTELCADRDPMDAVAIVVDDSRPVGSLSFEDLHTDAITVSECMEPLTPDRLVSSTTSLIEALGLFYSDQKRVFFVLTNSTITHWLCYLHFSKLPFNLCLWALVLGLEQLMLELCQATPQRCLDLLPPNRLTKAKEIYRLRGYSVDSQNREHAHRLISCTNMIDKFTMLQRHPEAPEVCSILQTERNLPSRIDKLRNGLAHAETDWDRAEELLPSAELVPLIRMTEKLYDQLEKYRDILIARSRIIPLTE